MASSKTRTSRPPGGDDSAGQPISTSGSLLEAGTIMIVGAPGAGKSTVSAALRQRVPRAQAFAVRLYSEHLQETGHPLGEAIAQSTKSGTQLIPLHLIERLFRTFMDGADRAGLLILEGFPINHAQALVADAELKRAGRRLDVVLHLDASLEVLRSRIRSRRVCPSCEREARSGFPQPLGSDYCARCGRPLERRLDDEQGHEARLAQHFREIEAIRASVTSASWVTIDTSTATPDDLIADVMRVLEERA